MVNHRSNNSFPGSENIFWKLCYKNILCSVISLAIITMINTEVLGDESLEILNTTPVRVEKIGTIESIEFCPAIQFTPWETSLLVEQAMYTDLVVIKGNHIHKTHQLPAQIHFLSFSNEGILQSTKTMDSSFNAYDFDLNDQKKERGKNPYQLKWESGNPVVLGDYEWMKNFLGKNRETGRIYCHIKNRKILLSDENSHVLSIEIDSKKMIALISTYNAFKASTERSVLKLAAKVLQEKDNTDFWISSTANSYYTIDLITGLRSDFLPGYDKDFNRKVSIRRQYRLMPGNNLLIQLYFEGPLNDHYGSRNLKRIALCDITGEEITALCQNQDQYDEFQYVEFCGNYIALSPGIHEVHLFRIQNN